MIKRISAAFICCLLCFSSYGVTRNAIAASSYTPTPHYKPSPLPDRRFLVDFGDPTVATTLSGWNNVSNSVAGTEVNLITADGSPSSINIQIVNSSDDGYGGLTGNQYNSAGYNGSVLDYPVSACNDSHFSFLTGGIYKLTGLLPDHFYTIRIFGSRAVTATDRKGTYTFNKKQKVLDAANNSSQTVVFYYLIPDAQGELTLDFGVAPGSQFGYLNVMDITETTTPGISAPSNLASQLLAVNGVLTWTDNSSNEQGFRIERRSSAQNLFEVIGEVGPNITEYADSSLTPGNYEYRVYAFNSIEESAYSNEIDLLVTEPVQGDRRFLIDFGDPAITTSVTGWNNVSNSMTGTNVNLVTSQDDSSFVNLVIVKSAANGYDGTGNQFNSAGYNGSVLDYPVSACSDSHYAYLTGGTYKIIGLNPDRYYTIRIFGSRNVTADDRKGTYTFNGKQMVLDAAGNSSQFIVFHYLKPSEEGELILDFGVAAGSTFGYLNVMDISEKEIPTINEPLALQAAVIDQSVTLNWIDNSANELGFKIERRIAGDTLFTEVGQVAAGVTEFTEEVPVNATGYEYRVFSFKSDENSAYSNSSNTGAIPAVSLSPSQIVLNQWAFQYKYDGRRRMTHKKVPGADWVYMVYDNRDRLVMTQDGNQRSGTNKNWLFTKYDALNRPVLTGIYEADSVLTQEKMQARVNRYYDELASNNGAWYETYVGDATGNVHGYDNQSFPVVENQDSYLTVTYYDNYLFKDLFNTPAFDFKDNELSVIGDQPGQDTTAFTRVVGQVTGTKVKMLGNTKSWLKSVNYYDDRYRLIQQITDNIKGHEVTTTVYDFVGKVLRNRTSLYLGQPVTWTNLVNAQVQGDMLVSTNASDWAGGAISSQSLSPGADGWAEFTVVQRTPFLMFGLADANADAHYNTIDYALFVYGSYLRIYESGVLRGTVGRASPGDVLRVERIDGKVYYKRNGLVLYTSTVASSGALFADVSFLNSGAKLSNGRLSNTFSGAVPLTASSSVIHRFTYDHAGRLEETWHQLDGSDEILLARNEYNELGQLIDKKLYSPEPESMSEAQRTFKQSVDYRYNIRGWLTSINNAALEPNSINDDMDDLFGMELAYQNDLNTGNANIDPELDLRQYNGNISAMKWSKNLGLEDNGQLAYNFKYDPMNRLLSALHLQSTASGTWGAGQYDESGLAYDLNGNIAKLKRNGKGGVLIDDLDYHYGSGKNASNKLVAVTDNTPDPTDKRQGFFDGNPNTDYTYDANGNMLRDENKGISSDIVYNHLNLPYQVTKSNAKITYLYDATGRKYGQCTSFGSLSEKLIEYIGPWVFENNEPQFLQHEEGRITLMDSETIYYTDCEDANGFMATANATLENETINGQTYLKVTGVSGMPFTKHGVAPIGGTFSVIEGTRYAFKVKGYRTDDGVSLYIRGNDTDLIWTGAALPQYASREMEVEQIFTIPPGITEITLGVLWHGSGTAGDPFYINSVGFYKITDSAPEYQYHLKDHLGNVRLTFTTKTEVETFTATMEDPGEANDFGNYDPTNWDLFDHTDSANVFVNSQHLHGGHNSQVALTKSLSVMPGDTIRVEVYAKYRGVENPGSGLAGFATALTDAFGLSGTMPGDPLSAFDVLDNYGTLIESGFDHSLDSVAPKAYLNVLLFDRDHNFVDAAYDQIETGDEQGDDPNVKDPHGLLEINKLVTTPGYAYIFVSNENPEQIDVYFDDMKVSHAKSPVIQMDDYYPFGLTFNSYNRDNSVPNQYQNTGREKQDELGLNWIDFGSRSYMPDIGRWNSLDDVADMFDDESPYSYAANNPANVIDIGGYFRISAEFANKYPTLAKMIAHYLPFLKANSTVKNAWMKITGGNSDQFDEMVTYDSGPEIIPTDPSKASIYNQNDPYSSEDSKFDPDHPDKLFIAPEALQELEQEMKAALNGQENELGPQMFYVSMKIMHEAAHYGVFKHKGAKAFWALEGNPRFGDQGAAWEKNAYKQFSYKSEASPSMNKGEVFDYYKKNYNSDRMLGMTLYHESWFNTMILAPASGTSSPAKKKKPDADREARRRSTGQ